MTDAIGPTAPIGDPPGLAASPRGSAAPPDTSVQVAAGDAGPGIARFARRWWPPLAGLMLGTAAGLLNIEPWQPSEPTTMLLPVLAIAYLVFGAVRGQLRRPGILSIETVGLVIFAGCAVLAALVDPEAGHYVAGAGWIGHAAWDVAHHRDLSHHHTVGVVPRAWAEFCIVADLLIGAALIAAPIA